MNCGSKAGTIENPARPRISAVHIAATIAGEGPALDLPAVPAKIETRRELQGFKTGRSVWRGSIAPDIKPHHAPTLKSRGLVRVKGGGRGQVDGTAGLPSAPEMPSVFGQLRLVPEPDSQSEGAPTREIAVEIAKRRYMLAVEHRTHLLVESVRR
jgi:hypothetical protein